MSVAMLDAPSTMSLEQALDHAWYALELDRSVECPVCHGEMHPRWSAAAGIVGGRCDDCGSTLE